MKRILLLAATALAVNSAFGQATFNTMDSLDINRLNEMVLVHGDMFWNPVAQVAHAYFPANSGKSINFVSTIWMSGYDAGNNLHVAAQTYRQSGNDYWPGPLDGSDTATYGSSYAWAKIWKVSRTDIQYFQSLSTRTTTNVPSAILSWPARGNTYATGNASTPLTITTDMAPFVDVNSNGIYEPLLGDYPDVKGDQALWWVFNDNGATHTATNGAPIKVEVHAMAYAYSRGTLVDNVAYYDFNIINKSPNNYHNFRFGLFDDIDLGYFGDDYIAFDSTWRMGIAYNGTNDDGASAGHPVNSYGLNPPQSGITMVVLPGDAGSSYVPAGSFIYYNNDFSVIGNPTSAAEYNNYLRGLFRNGATIDSQMTADTSYHCYHSRPGRKYVYPDPATDTNGWNECVCHDNPGDRRFIISSNDFTFNSGSTQHIVFAQVVADSAGACPGANFNSINIVADTAWADYFNPPPPLPASVAPMPNNTYMRVYPNPASNKLYVVNTAGTADDAINIYNTLGQRLELPVAKEKQKDVIDISALPTGIYYLQYRSGDMQTTTKFLKE